MQRLAATIVMATMMTSGSMAMAEKHDNPEELGRVNWRRGFASGLAEAAKVNRPALVLFDEVPGCSTVRSYGNRVLSHPLIVEAAETLFVPVVVYNNVSGDDRAVLESFKEPAWNNPVVRIMDANKKPLSTRVAGDYSVAALAAAMVDALKAANESVPGYLELLAADHPSRAKGKATFAMYCFWSGEVAIGSVPGVISTEAGFFDGREVVEATFDPQVVSYEALVSSAKAAGQADAVFARSDAQLNVAKKIVGRSTRADGAIRSSAKDTKYQIRNTALRFLPMTPAQATKVNASAGGRGDANQYLSAGQRALYAQIRANPKAGWPVVLGEADFMAAYGRTAAVAAELSR